MEEHGLTFEKAFAAQDLLKKFIKNYTSLEEGEWLAIMMGLIAQMFIDAGISYDQFIDALTKMAVGFKPTFDLKQEIKNKYGMD